MAMQRISDRSEPVQQLRRMLLDVSTREGGGMLYCPFPEIPCTCALHQKKRNTPYDSEDESSSPRGGGESVEQQRATGLLELKRKLDAASDIGVPEGEGECLYLTMALVLEGRQPIAGGVGWSGWGKDMQEGAKRLKQMVREELSRNAAQYTLGLTVEEVQEHVAANSHAGRYELEVMSRLFNLEIHLYEVTTRGTFLRTFPHTFPGEKEAKEAGESEGVGGQTGEEAAAEEAEGEADAESAGTHSAQSSRNSAANAPKKGGVIIRVCQRMHDYWPIAAKGSDVGARVARAGAARARPQTHPHHR